MSQKANWFNKPTKKTLTVFTALTILGVTLLVLAMSDFFTETIFQRKNIILMVLIMMNISSLFKLFRNYRKSI